MKTLLKLLSLVLLCSCVSESGPKVSHNGIIPAINAPRTLQFLGESYVAGYSARDGDKCVVEYFRAGERQKAWKKMLGLRINGALLDSLQWVGNIEKNVKAGGASAVRTFKGKSNDEYGIEYTLMSHDLVELDVFRFVNSANGTISFQYTENIPSEKLREVGEARLPEYYGGIRSKVVNAMESGPMPVIEMAKDRHK